MKILVNTPYLILQGGVANHYLGLRNYWNETVVYNPVGKRSKKSGSGIYWLPIDILVFIFRIYSFYPDIVLLNPSLSKSALIRDMIFLRIADLLGKKVVVFFHGFDKNNISNVDLSSLTKNLNKCACVFCLANEFKNIIRSWGVTVPICLTTTKVDDVLIKNFDISCREGEIKTILFLARITKAKGIFIALKTFKQCLSQYPYLVMRIVGDGPDLEEAKEVCMRENIANVKFLGPLSGEELIQEYKTADIYLLPTYTEGMPTSVLEAMSFGLPVITRPVGGLCDFFVDGEMGKLIDSFNPDDFSSTIIDYVQKPEKVKHISLVNYEYAMKNFMASTVAKKFESELRKYI